MFEIWGDSRMANHFGMRIKTRMASEELEDRLSKCCQSKFAYSFDGTDEKDGMTVKIMILSFATVQDRDVFRASLRKK